MGAESASEYAGISTNPEPAPGRDGGGLSLTAMPNGSSLMPV